MSKCRTTRHATPFAEHAIEQDLTYTWWEEVACRDTRKQVSDLPGVACCPISETITIQYVFWFTHSIWSACMDLDDLHFTTRLLQVEH